MIEVTEKTISPEQVINLVREDSCGCVVTYVGLIRNNNQGKPVMFVEYQNPKGDAVTLLKEIATEAKNNWPIEQVAISHRVGRLKVGEINLVVAVGAAHRREGFAACQYIIDKFKESLPTRKTEIYRDKGTAEADLGNNK